METQVPKGILHTKTGDTSGWEGRDLRINDPGKKRFGEQPQVNPDLERSALENALQMHRNAFRRMKLPGRLDRIC